MTKQPSMFPATRKEALAALTVPYTGWFIGEDEETLVGGFASEEDALTEIGEYDDREYTLVYATQRRYLLSSLLDLDDLLDTMSFYWARDEFGYVMEYVKGALDETDDLSDSGGDVIASEEISDFEWRGLGDALKKLFDDPDLTPEHYRQYDEAQVAELTSRLKTCIDDWQIKHWTYITAYQFHQILEQKTYTPAHRKK